MIFDCFLHITDPSWRSVAIPAVMSQRRGTKPLCDQAKLHQKNLWKDVTLIFLPIIVKSNQDWFDVNTMKSTNLRHEFGVETRFGVSRRILNRLDSFEQRWTVAAKLSTCIHGAKFKLNMHRSLYGFMVSCVQITHMFIIKKTFLHPINAWIILIWSHMHILYGMCKYGYGLNKW